MSSRGTVAFYPSAFALGLVALGITAPRLTGRGRRHAAFTLAVVGLGCGASLIAAALAPVVSLVGALIMGTAAALVVALVPALGTDVRGTRAAGLLSRANSLSSAAGLAAPLLIAAAVFLGVGWAAGYLVVPLAGAVGLLVVLRRVELPDAEPPPATVPETRAARDEPVPEGQAPPTRRTRGGTLRRDGPVAAVAQPRARRLRRVLRRVLGAELHAQQPRTADRSRLSARRRVSARHGDRSRRGHPNHPSHRIRGSDDRSSSPASPSPGSQSSGLPTSRGSRRSGSA